MSVDHIFLDRCLEFSVKVYGLVNSLSPGRLGQKMRDQVIASSSSIGANIAEANSAQSRADYVSKFEIALKEARETDFRLAFISRVTRESEELQVWLARECYELIAVLVASVKTIKNNTARNGKLEMRDQK
jgi:four helix bundle protein